MVTSTKDCLEVFCPGVEAIVLQVVDEVRHADEGQTSAHFVESLVFLVINMLEQVSPG